MQPSFELLVWRASLEAAPRIPSVLDLADWASILAAAGETAGADFLADVVALWRGFADRPSPSATGSPDRPVPAWTIDTLLAELDALGRDFMPQDTPPRRRRVSGDPDEEGGIGPINRPVLPPADLAAAAAGLRAFLASPVCRTGEAAAAAAILASLVEAGRRLPDLDYRRLRDAPLAELAVAIGFTALAAFAFATRDLAVAPLGSMAFLHRVAGLDPDGLGPYLSGVALVARKGCDVFDLARRAARASGGLGGIDVWRVLLSRGCSGLLLLEIVDDLGDADRSRALSLILDRTLSCYGEIDRHLVRRLRDAGLDNADWALAARAQAAIVRSSPREYHEQVILGSIQATGGDYGSAESVFRDCLRQRKDDPDVAARLYAARRNSFTGFEVTRGYESPADRQDVRLRRRRVAPDHIARHGERITAVDVA